MPKVKILSTVVRCLHKEEDVKKTVKRKIGKVKFFKNNLFYFLFEFQEYYQPWLGYAFLLSLSLFFIHTLLEAVIEKC